MISTCVLIETRQRYRIITKPVNRTNPSIKIKGRLSYLYAVHFEFQLHVSGLEAR